MENEIEKKLTLMFAYIAHKEKYQSKLLFTINSKIWDLAIVVAWQCSLLFFYEHFSQISPTLIGEKWDEKFNSSKEKKLSNEVNLTNIYWPNEKKDEEVITFVKEIYPVEDNVIKQLRILLTERNRCAHVTDIETVKNEFLSFLDKQVRIFEIIQEKHKQYLLDYIKNDGLCFSSVDISFVVPERIDQLLQSTSFVSAESTEKDLEKYINYFSKEHTTKLLRGIVNTKSSINQILSAGYTLDFLKKLYAKTKNFGDIWWDFVDEFKIDNIDSLGITGYAFQGYKKWLEEISIDIIPF